MSRLIQKNLRSLSFGLAQQSNKQIYTSYRTLYKIGPSSIPFIEKQLMGEPWNKIIHKSQMSLLTGLLNLIHDIHEESAVRVGKALNDSGCCKVVSLRISTIMSQTSNNFHIFYIRGIPIYLSKYLNHQLTIRKKLEALLRILPEADLKGIERFHIGPISDEFYIGTYMPILNNILVEWIEDIFVFGALENEHTLYHEIGHHVNKHTFGHDLSQEREADDYADKMMKINHPIWTFTKKAIRCIFQ